MSKPGNYEFEEICIRSTTAVVKRSLALFGVVSLASGAPKDEVVAWLTKDELWGDLSPNELNFLSASSVSEKQVIQFSWRSEALAVLLWSLRIVSSLLPPDRKCNATDFMKLLPPCIETPTKEFIALAKLREPAEIFQFADDCFDLHAEARAVRRGQRAAKTPLDIEIIQERHYAINWVIGYNSQPWDGVTTDT